MNNLSTNEIKILLKIFKDFNSYHNANNLSKELGLSAMGALKIVKNLEKQGLIQYDLIGKAKMYHVNLKNDYARQYISFLLRKEAEESKSRIKRWVVELKKLKSVSNIGILFGSVIRSDQYNDIDVLVVLKQSQIKEFNKLVEELNQINVKRIHTVKQSIHDLKDNLVNKDKVVLNVLRNGIILFGYDKLVEVIEGVSR